MKRLALLTLLSTSAFADRVPFNEKFYLDMVGGDPARAKAVKGLCNYDGISLPDCKKKFEGKGNFAAEAALKCEIDRVINLPTFKFDNEPSGARANRDAGSSWHEYQHDGHAHGYSAGRRNSAANEAFDRRLNQINTENNSFKGAESKTSGTKAEGGIEAGIPGAFTVNFTFGGDNSKSITVNKLTPDQIKALKAAWLDGWNDPSRWGSDPDIVILPDGTTRGGSPAPKKTPEEIKAEKKEDKNDEKKGAENPPNHEDESTPHVPDTIIHHEGPMMAGESNLDVTGVATPVIEDLSVPSQMESCLKKETKRLTENLGRMNIDPNSQETESTTAGKLLKFGYCDEQVLGKAACFTKKFKEKSVVAVTIQEERKEAARQAMDSFKLTGICDANTLGREFCKAEKFKWETTPADIQEIPTEGGRIAKPTRSGDIPKSFDH